MWSSGRGSQTVRLLYWEWGDLAVLRIQRTEVICDINGKKKRHLRLPSSSSV